MNKVWGSLSMLIATWLEWRSSDPNWVSAPISAGNEESALSLLERNAQSKNSE